jgi:phosphoribosylanthranilate isomerase
LKCKPQRYFFFSSKPMPLKTLVKVGSITNLSDARYCAGMGADLLGFCVVERQPAYVTPKSFQEIRGWITGPRIVAQAVGVQSAADLAFIIEQYRPDFLELGTAEVALLGTIPLPYILILSKGNVIPSGPSPAYVLVADQETYVGEIPTLLQIMDARELEGALSNARIHGIVLEGSSEIRPGLKSYDQLADILEALEVD